MCVQPLGLKCILSIQAEKCPLCQIYFKQIPANLTVQIEMNRVCRGSVSVPLFFVSKNSAKDCQKIPERTN